MTPHDKINKQTRQFNVSLVKWPGPIPLFEAYRELAETVNYGLRRLGYDSILSTQRVYPDRTNIVMGFHILTADDLNRLPDGTILYNLEQIDHTQPQKPAVENIPARFRVWDYSARNCESLKMLGVVNPVLVPIGYVPEMARIEPAKVRDIDVLFYGLLNRRRSDILTGLKRRGLRVASITGVYGSERDKYIARARVVLNMHLYQTQIFEAVRVSYLLANSKAVVSEHNTQTVMDERFKDAAVLVPYEKLVDACVELVQNPEKLQYQEQRGFSIFSMLDEAIYLRAALGAAE